MADPIVYGFPRHGSSLDLARDVLGYRPEYDMAAAVRDLVDWFKAKGG